MKMDNLMVVGAGAMGTGIAQVGLASGMYVVVYDSFPAALERSKTILEKNFSKLAAKGKITEEEKADCLGRVTFTGEIDPARDADIIIEAIIENIEAKKDIHAKLSEICKEDAILASNTSTISITEIAAAVKKPERFLGMHFFNPVPAMKLLELVKGLTTEEETIEAAKAFGEKIGKIVIVSKDSCGFIANRIGSPMLNAAVKVLEAGTGTREDIDAAMKYGWGFPMGPLELIDLVGVDVQLAVMEVLYEETGDSYYKPAPLLKRMAAARHLGRKTGKGFYDYTK